MKRYTALFAIVFVLLALLLGSISVALAEGPDPGDPAPMATVEPAATLAVIAPDGSTTPVTVTLPAAVDGALSNMERAFWVFVVVALVILIVAREMHHNTQIKDMVSLETARSIYNEAAGFLNYLTQRIPGPGDDAIKNVALGIWDDQLKKWEQENARSTSTTMINVNSPAPTAGVPGGDALPSVSPG